MKMKFGAEKGRMLLLVSFLVPVAICFGVYQVNGAQAPPSFSTHERKIFYFFSTLFDTKSIYLYG